MFAPEQIILKERFWHEGSETYIMKRCSETKSQNDIPETTNHEPKVTKQNVSHENYEMEVPKQKLPTVSSKTEVMVPMLRVTIMKTKVLDPKQTVVQPLKR